MRTYQSAGCFATCLVFLQGCALVSNTTIDRFPRNYGHFVPDAYENFYRSRPCTQALEFSEDEVRDNHGTLLLLSTVEGRVTIYPKNGVPIEGELVTIILDSLKKRDSLQESACRARQLGADYSDTLRNQIAQLADIGFIIHSVNNPIGDYKFFDRMMRIIAENINYSVKYEGPRAPKEDNRPIFPRREK
jgi:hypothetical protein